MDEAPAWFRPDIEGLRGVAVLLIVLFHLDTPHFYGAWVGVDVFYVISGFVITGTIARQAATSEGFSIAGFYASRARRIIPASVVVLLAATLWIRFVDGPVVMKEFSGEIRAAALFVANLRYAARATDYGVVASPFQHFWSLAVEEQFYLVWPLLVWPALRVRGSARIGPEGRLAALAALVGVTSGVVLLLTSSSDPLWAFYMLPARAWELAAGAGVAIVSRRLEPLRTWPAVVLGWGGLLLLAFSARVSTPPTGALTTTAPLTVLATSAVLLAAPGAMPLTIGWVLSRRPLRAIGRISYGIYLWHLPLLVLVASPNLFTDSRSSWAENAAVVIGGSPALAALSHALIERPIRLSRTFRGRTGRTLVGASTLVALTVSATIVLTPRSRLPTDAGRAATPPAPAQQAELSRLGLPADATGYVPSDLRPTLERADRVASATWPVCTPADVPGAVDLAVTQCPPGGSPSAPSATVVLYGDSEAGHFSLPFARAAAAHGWRFVLMSRVGCRWRDDPSSAECAQWRERSLDLLASLRPDVIVLSEFDRDLPSIGEPAFVDNSLRTLARLPRESRLVILSGVPVAGGNPVRCLRAHLDSVRKCDFRRARSTDGIITAANRDVARRAGAMLVDPARWVCPTRRCALVRGDVLVYRDFTHLTDEFALTLTPRVDALLSAAQPLRH